MQLIDSFFASIKKAKTIMKKTILILILVMASLSLSAQERVYYSIEFLEAGIGFGTGPKIVR